MPAFGTTPLGQFFFGMALASTTPGGTVPVAPPERTFTVPKATGEEWIGYKTPEEIKNFTFLWTDAELEGAAVTASQWTLESGDVEEVISGVGADNGEGVPATIIIAAGVNANIYNITNLVTLDNGLKLDATFRLFVQKYNQ